MVQDKTQNIPYAAPEIFEILVWKVKSHLVECGLGNGVILYLEKIFMFGKNAEDVSEGGQG